MSLLRFAIGAIAALLAMALSIPVLLLGIPFWTVAAAVRLQERALRRWRRQELSWHELIEFVPRIGWKNRGNVHAVLRGERRFVVTTDADGWRGRSTIEESELVAFGDSFAFGHGVDDERFFTEQATAVRMKAVGVNGYNMIQELQWMELLRDRLAGKFVVWFVFYGNDVIDNLHPNFKWYRTPFVRSVGEGSEWEVVTDHVREDPWRFPPKWAIRNKAAEICSPGYQSDRAFAACDFLIGRARALCDSVGARLAIVGIPDVATLDPAQRDRLRRQSPDPQQFDVGRPDTRLREICTRRELPFLALSEAVGVHDHLPNDCHWTPAGHAKVARALERLYEREMRAGKALGEAAVRTGGQGAPPRERATVGLP